MLKFIKFYTKHLSVKITLLLLVLSLVVHSFDFAHTQSISFELVLLLLIFLENIELKENLVKLAKEESYE